MEIDGLTTERLHLAAELIARCQAQATSHIGYDAIEAAAVTTDLEALEPVGLEGVTVATLDGEVIGVLAGEWDSSPPRCWWHGPYVDADHDWGTVADALYARARTLLPPDVTQEEFAPDARNERVAAFAHRHGFTCDEGSAVLTRPLDGRPWALPDGDGSVAIRPLADAERVAVARLHDGLFADTHTTGDRLAADDPDRVVMVATGPDGLLGYAAGEIQSDASGYLDFLGVAPAARRRGIGAALVVALGTVLHDEHGCTVLHLTVREGNTAARALYTGLGFDEERILRPWRLGFSLDGS